MSDFKIVSLLNPGGINFNSGVVGISAGTQLQTTGTVSFGDSNGVSFGLSDGTLTASIAAGAFTHNSDLHTGDVIPAAVQDFKNFAYSLGTAGVPAASADRLVFYGFNQNGKTRFGMITPDGSQITHAQDQFIIARNTSGAPIPSARAVYVTGSTGQTPNISPAQSDDIATMPAIGITVDSIANNGFGRVMIGGIAGDLDTDTPGWVEGDRLWVSDSSPGELTASEPSYPSLRQRIAIVINVSTTQGKLLILNTGARGEFGIQAISAGTTQMTSGGAEFSNANGISFGVDGNTVTASHNGLTSQSNQALSGSNGSFTFQTATFGNLNGLSFYTSNGSMVGSYTVPTQSVQTLGGYFFTTDNGYGVAGTIGESSSSTLDARSLSIELDGGISGGFSNGSLQLRVIGSGAAIADVGYANDAGVQTYGWAAQDHAHKGVFSFGVSTAGNAVGDTRVDAGQFVMQGGANITLSQITDNDGANTIIISGGAGGAGNTGSISAGTTRGTLGEVVFSDSNGISFGINGQTVTASHNGVTAVPVVSDAIQPLSSVSGSGTNTSRFAADDHVHAGFSALGVSTLGNTNGQTGMKSGGQIVFAGLGNATAFQLTAAGGLNTVEIAVNDNKSMFMAGNTTVASSGALTLLGPNKISFSGLGIASVGVSNSQVVISATQSDQAASASNGSFAFQTLGFSNANNVTFGTSAGSIITASINPGGGAALTVQDSATTLSVTKLVFSNGGGVSFGLNTAADIATLTASAPAGGGGGTVDRYLRAPVLTQAGSSVNNSSISIFPFNLPGPLAMSNARFALSLGGATTTNNTAAGIALSASVVLYTRNVSTLSWFNSGSQTFTASHSSNATASKFGARAITINLASATTLVPDEYWVALHISTATSFNTSLAHSISMGVLPSLASAMAGLDPWSNATTNTRGAMVGMGVFSTNATRATIAFSALTGQAGNSATLANLWCDFRNWSIW